ncbi:hypothetical protein [Caballeronia insecticola]|uniref:hypothetical protein n=1 Tax=Caballeronia insecticola TaxID=758793 RepID=UPI001182B2DA|nr:hypothetical protein [Caballeronia insecticola]
MMPARPRDRARAHARTCFFGTLLHAAIRVANVNTFETRRVRGRTSNIRSETRALDHRDRCNSGGSGNPDRSTSIAVARNLRPRFEAAARETSRIQPTITKAFNCRTEIKRQSVRRRKTLVDGGRVRSPNPARTLRRRRRVSLAAQHETSYENTWIMSLNK